MGIQKFFRNNRMIGNLTVDKTLTASSDLTVAGTFTANGGIAPSSGLTYSINLVSSSEGIRAGGMNGFSSTGKGRQTHNLLGAPVSGMELEIFPVVTSGSSVTHKVLSSTDIGSTVVFNSSIVADGRGIVFGTSVAMSVRMVGVSATEWQF